MSKGSRKRREASMRGVFANEKGERAELFRREGRRKVTVMLA
ncbi:MAG: hypothetical protein Q4D60_00560 [Eubacteriales bacterium]|nr:hypothetical protein [Eubacteriales bacterium]